MKSLVARRLPWWLVVLLGATLVALGAVLTADPFRSLGVLAALVGATLLVSGASELSTAEDTARPWLARVVGAAWVAAGIATLAWPGITIRALATALGVALVVGGAFKTTAATTGATGDERWVLGLGGLASVLFGVLALSWPDLTVLALAVLFGVRTVIVGFGQVALGWKLRGSSGATARKPWPRPLRLAGTGVALVLALGGMGLSIAIDRAHPAAPGAFYTPPSPLPAGPPGTVIRSEVVPGFHAGATTYRVLYLSTGYEGKPAAVSGLVLVPNGAAPTGGRKVVAYTHGTVGVASNCAPSLRGGSGQPLFFEGGAALLAAGYVIAAPDYQGLGTSGPHPYLVGASEAENALDAVRAADNLPAAHASRDFAVWGHSQGGHAALFTGQLASTYAPELRLVGVAAGAPVPNLVDLFQVNIRTAVGKILIAMALSSWERVYHEASLGRIVTAAARPAVARIARYCLYDRKQILASVPSALVLGLTFLRAPVWQTEPWKTIAERNTPGAVRIHAPLLVVQGAADSIVDPTVTKRLVAKLCARGDTVDLRLYEGVGHLETGHDAAPDVERWLADRFAGKPAPTSCPA